MYNESIVYGYIKNANVLNHEDKHRIERVNRQVLAHLPSVDDASLLCKEFFSTPPRLNYDDRMQSSIIHFGGAYEGIEYEWSLWMTHFEQLLQQMYWDSVVVHLETELSGTHTFTWDSGDTNHTPSDQPLNIRCEWQHEIGLGACSA